jgi:hypothetical protein
LLVLGAALLGKSYQMPAHIDEAKARLLTENYERDYFDVSPEARKAQEAEIVSLRTGKWRLRSIGIVVILFSLALILVIVLFRLWGVRNLGSATTPRSRSQLVALATLACLTLIPATFLELQDEYIQDDLMPHSDFGQGIFVVLGIPIIVTFSVFATVIFALLIVPNANLPANLWCVDSSRPCRNAAFAAVSGILVALLALLISWSLMNFVWALPSEMLGVYVVLNSGWMAESRIASVTRNPE